MVEKGRDKSGKSIVPTGAESETTGRKGGERLPPNGEDSPTSPTFVPLPWSLVLQMPELSGDMIKALIVFLAADEQSGKEGMVVPLPIIADGAGLSERMARRVLLALQVDDLVEETPDGWRLTPPP